MTNTSKPTEAVQVSASQAFCYWLKLGFLSFGGPAGQIAMMHDELVQRRRWISESHFLHALNYCMLLPGPEATQLAIYIGWLMHGLRGALMAGICFVLPGFMVLCGLSWLYLNYGQHSLMSAVMYSIKPAIIALVLAAAWRLGKKSLNSRLTIATAIFSLLAVLLLRLPFPLIVAVAAVLGWLQRPATVATPSTNPNPTPAGNRLWQRAARILVCGSLLMAIPMALLVWQYGSDALLSRLAVLFSKAALVSFGGAYAVLPYVFQAAVSQFHWLTPAQMMDGLALGETTPGPLIMIVAFIGFLAGWQNALSSHLLLLPQALLAASVATYFTFLPSFVLVLAGAPLIEWTRHQRGLHAPLAMIAAAVVGVIVSLAVFFAQHILLRGNGSIDYLAVLLSALAITAVFYLQQSSIRLLIWFAALGLLLHFCAPPDWLH